MAGKKSVEKEQLADRDYINSYFVKRPPKDYVKGYRISFSIIQKSVNSKGEILSRKTIKTDTIKKINQDLIAKRLSWDDANRLINEIKDNLLKQDKKLRGQLLTHSKNELWMNKYIEKVYSYKRKKTLKDWDSAKNEITRAFVALGDLDLATATQDEIEEQIDKHCAGNIKRSRNVTKKLNSVLRSGVVRTDIHKLSYSKKPERIVRYVTHSELKGLVTYIKSNVDKSEIIGGLTRDEFISLIQTLYYSGLRIGEALAASKRNWDSKERVFHVLHQLDRKGNKRLPKGDKTRKTVIPKIGAKAFQSWLEVKNKSKVDSIKISKTLKKYCKAHFDDETNHLSCHDLRHSFANYLLKECGFTMQATAMLLGNSVAVCEEYYYHWKPHDETLKFISEKTG